MCIRSQLHTRQCANDHNYRPDNVHRMITITDQTMRKQSQLQTRQCVQTGKEVDYLVPWLGYPFISLEIKQFITVPWLWLKAVQTVVQVAQSLIHWINFTYRLISFDQQQSLWAQDKPSKSLKQNCKPRSVKLHSTAIPCMPTAMTIVHRFRGSCGQRVPDKMTDLSSNYDWKWQTTTACLDARLKGLGNRFGKLRNRFGNLLYIPRKNYLSIISNFIIIFCHLISSKFISCSKLRNLCNV